MKAVTIKNSGATFTPTELADFLAGKILDELKQEKVSTFTILDPACGEVELLNSIAKKIKLKYDHINIYLKGFDTNMDYIKG